VSEIRVYGRNSGFPLSQALPELQGQADDPVYPIECQKIIKENDLIFLALPHQISMEIAPQLQGSIPIIDLSADYRLDSAADYQKWYGVEHLDADGLRKFVYGLPEWKRDQLKTANHIACPGCYPTSVLLALIPLLEKGWIKDGFIVDSKSGHSGAGKKLSQMLHAGQITENIQPYKILNHQHKGEIGMVVGAISKGAVTRFTFTPQIMPFDRGILSCIYIDLHAAHDLDTITECYRERYAGEPFIRFLPATSTPSLKNVTMTNFCDLFFALDDTLNRLTVISCIDNLIKGAAGQAVQVMNIVKGFDERDGLS